MQISWDDIIARGNVYLDNDHRDDGGWLRPESALAIAQAEYRQLYRRWVQSSLIAPAWIDFPFTGYTVTIGGTVSDVVTTPVLATIGVAEDLGAGEYRALEYGQSQWGRSPTYGYTTARGRYWYATGEGDKIAYTLEPRDSASYFVRYIPVPVLTALSSDTIEIPMGSDERLVLGFARRAHLKDSSASALLNGLIADADATLNMAAFNRALQDSPRVRRNPRQPFKPQFPSSPNEWVWR